MPDHSRRRSRDPATDDERPRRTRRPSDAVAASQERRKRRGHRATDSTGELLAKAAPLAGSSSTPTKSGDSSRDSGAPLSLGALAELDRVNKKREKKKGWNTYDEAYVAETQAREEALEEERRKKERRREKRRLQDEELEAEAERERLQERRRRREEKRARRESERVTEDEAHKRRTDVKRHKRRIPGDAMFSDTDNPRTPDRKRKQKYQKLDDRGTPDSRQEPKSKRKTRLISGPYLEDGRAEKVYKHEKNIHDSDVYEDHAARKAKMKKYMCKLYPLYPHASGQLT
jgi:glucan 1,3-beta-glucosidase